MNRNHLAIAGIGILTLLLLHLFYPALTETMKICWESEDYSHGLLLPFIAAYLAWQQKPEAARGIVNQNIPPQFPGSKNPESSGHETVSEVSPLKTISGDESYTPPTFPRRNFQYSAMVGIPLLVLGLIASLLGQISGLLFFSWFGFFPALLGSLFLIFGIQPILPFVGPILLNFMAKPLPDSLVPKLFFPLQVLAAKVSAFTLDSLQVPVYLHGNIIEIPGMKLMVEEACSGLRSLMAILTVAFIVLLTTRIPWWAKTLIALLSICMAVALNVFRVAITGVLAHFVDPRMASGFFHSFSGILVFLIGLILLYGIGNFFEKRFPLKKAMTSKEGLPA